MKTTESESDGVWYYERGSVADWAETEALRQKLSRAKELLASTEAQVCSLIAEREKLRKERDELMEHAHSRAQARAWALEQAAEAVDNSACAWDWEHCNCRAHAVGVIRALKEQP